MSCIFMGDEAKLEDIVNGARCCTTGHESGEVGEPCGLTIMPGKYLPLQCQYTGYWHFVDPKDVHSNLVCIVEDPSSLPGAPRPRV